MNTDNFPFEIKLATDPLKRRLSSIENKQIWTLKSIRTINGLPGNDLGNIDISAGVGSGDVAGPATNTDLYIPQWNGANSKTLKDGLAVPAGGLAGITALNAKLTANVAISGATKTKITYDANGLVTVGADATTADIADSSNKRYVTDANLTTIGNQSGTNTGDNVAASTSVVGLTPIVTAPAAGNLNVLGVANAETARTDKLLLDATAPTTQAFADAAAAGTSLKAARIDHKHAMMAAPTTVSGNAGTVTNGVYANAANSMSLINPLTTIAESWIGPSTTNGIYFKGGNVGIGTTTPGAALQIGAGSGGFTDFTNGIQFGDDTSARLYHYTNGWIGTNATIYSSAGIQTPNLAFQNMTTVGSTDLTIKTLTGYSNNIIFKSNGTTPTETMRLTSLGNVGIGTTAPATGLEILRTTEQLRLSYDSTHFSSFTVNSAGDLTLVGGTTAKLTATTFVGALTGIASGNLTSANIEDSIIDAHTTIAPSGNAVFDALALKAPVASPTFTGVVTAPQIINSQNNITASGNAATVPITYKLNEVTNNSAATLTITLTTASAVDGQMAIVKVVDFSAAAQTLTLVNTENSTVTAPATTNGSTTLPLTLGFMFNSGTTKWRLIAVA